MLLDSFKKEIEVAHSVQDLRALQAKYIGKKGLVKQEMKKLAKLPREEKKDFAQQINAIRKEIEQVLYGAIQKAEQRQIEEKLQSEWQDLSLDGLGIQRGSRHPLTKIERKCMDVLRQLGFNLVDGRLTSQTTLPHVHPTAGWTAHTHSAFHFLAPRARCGPMVACGSMSVLHAKHRG